MDKKKHPKEEKREEKLNERQNDAVLHTQGPVLILAGAGAGKTKTITHRILHLIREGVAPETILAVTFTNKAAGEMKERVADMLFQDPVLNMPIPFRGTPFISTFHSLGVHILKENSRMLNLPKHFSIYTRDDSQKAMREAIEAVELDPKQFEPRRLLASISRQKGEGIGYREYAESARDFYAKIVSRVWEKYEGILFREKALDFDDLLLKTQRLLKESETVREYYQNTWHYIHIDEYQDTNRVQHDIAQLLSQKHRNLCVVGDIDQNIYSWRGANLENLLDFESTYPDAHVVVLEENYRSTQTIIGAANEIIRKNIKRKEKNLFTNNEEGEKISLYGASDENDEAYFVATHIQDLLKQGVSPSDMAVLYRANFQSRVLEESLLGAGIPYQVLGTRFFERREIRDVLSYVRVALNPESFSDIKRISNVPPRGIGKVTLLKIAAGAEDTLPRGAKEKVASFRGILAEIAQVAREKKPSETIRFVLSKSGMGDVFKRGGEDEKERLENVKELVTLATKYDRLPQGEGIPKLLEDAALASDQDELEKKNDAVRLMTVHASKGLEFSYVFITGLEDGLFPHERNDEAADDEEERRLFYVALTRARKKIFLSYAAVRTIFGAQRMSVPSEFITDISEDFLSPETPRRFGIATIFLE